MAESYCVFIGEEKAISAFAEKHNELRVFDYSPGVKLVPYTSVLHAALCREYGGNPPGDFLEGSNSLNTVLSSLVCEASFEGKIAYILEEHFGGWRDNESILWENGEIILGPSLDYEDQLKVLRELPIDEKHRYYFTKYDSSDEWLQNGNC